MLRFDEGEIAAAMAELHRLRQANREAMRFFTTLDQPEFVRRWSIVTDEVAEYASRIAPWWTGTLSSAHRSALLVEDDTIIGSGFIDPSVVNPIFGGRPAEYGIEVHKRKPWMTTALSHMSRHILETLTEATTITVNDIYAEVS